jgi:phosphatidylserine/phosphatidylglycerophosphate/cardiolipin synthase-like enzyme
MVKKTWICLLGLGLLSATACWAIDIDVSEAPSSDLDLTVSAFQNATTSILLNIYDLSSPQIADALIGRIQAGVHVEILEEGQPVGGLSAAGKGIQSQLAQAMNAAGNGDKLYEMTSKAGGKRRFRYDHAKYAVIDDNQVLIGSENYSPTGNPTPGSLGNRGWEVLIHDADLAQQFKGTFQADAVTSFNDVLDLTANASYDYTEHRKTPSPTGEPTHREPTRPEPTHPKPNRPAPDRSDETAGSSSMSADSVTRIMSPDTSEQGLIALIKSARATLDIEQMTFDPAWGKAGGTSPLYDAVVEAARRHVQVRVLLNDERVFDHPSHPSKPKNTVLQANLNQLAQSEGLNASVRIANIKAMGVDYIHNKGVLIDGSMTLISSINWDENSVEHNREAAVLIVSPDVAAHYDALFAQDWQDSESSSDDVPAAGENTENPEQLSIMSAMTSTQAPSFACPDQISLSVQVGELDIQSQADADFQTLSNKLITGKFTHAKTQQGCVLTQADLSTDGTSNRKFVEIRSSPNDGLSLILEGYTPKTQKIYSIRAKLDSRDEIDGTWDAQVYEGSGAREALGGASMTINQ